jgi:predicted PhzF superfamily epimerase YddE/YHI9
MQTFIVNAFTSRPFGGNPAAVCPVPEALPEVLMQAWAEQFNLSETVFVWPQGLPGDYVIRWFTPTTEVNLCGHATLAAAHVLLEELGLPLTELRFHSRSGVLPVLARQGRLQLDFPLIAVSPLADTASGELGVLSYQAGEDRMWVLPSAQAVRDFAPDYPAIAALNTRGLIITAAGDDCDFVSRFFAPNAGILEDPVTGSAHCALVSYWGQALQQRHFFAKQLSRREGELWLEQVGERVLMQGHAITRLRGQCLAVPASA